MKNICIALLLLSRVSFSQELIDFNYKRDFDKILKESKNKKSPDSYQKLLPRFLKGDSTLTEKQLLTLQIGFTDNKKYWPYTHLKKEREIWLLNDEEKFEEAIVLCDSILNENPFNLLANREKSYALQKLKRDSFEIFFKRFEMLVNTNLSTGTGFSIDSSWFVLGPADGQLMIVAVFAAKVCYMNSQTDTNGYIHDVLGMKLNDLDYCAKLYFNVHHAANRMFSESDKKKMKTLIKEDAREIKRSKKKEKKKNKKQTAFFKNNEIKLTHASFLISSSKSKLITGSAFAAAC
ncbi:MAG: DUF4919 domain-containing protein [Bacteroidetes bacterium]|nr:DUF4919 domain-containing protein [Bacteroidota bacterium]MBV6460938.1 hypothetical protein [Flavobacteriales bacterium]WKZ75665.1 MAG: DUF4919 domain-containing protein [Vicingaceae bacterium]MCL4815230.1 DUF4919 domain-containing protein [Flavobacteriales bacterium]NOG94572.1 DUF4919 domain-containing protein [Bacteroidota bacterium]